MVIEYLEVRLLRLAHTRWIVFVSAVCVVAGLLVVWSVPGAVAAAHGASREFWIIGGLAVIADVRPSPLPQDRAWPSRTVLSVCFTFAMLLIWGPAPAIVVQAIAAAVAVLRLRLAPAEGAFLAARLICALGAAGLAQSMIGPRVDLGSGFGSDDFAAVAVPAVAWFVVRFGLLVVGRMIEGLGSVRAALRSIRGELLSTAALLLLVAPLLTTATGWWLLVIAIPLFAWNRLARGFEDQEQHLRHESVSGTLNRRGLVAGVDALVAGDRQRPQAFGLLLVDLGPSCRSTATSAVACTRASSSPPPGACAMWWRPIGSVDSRATNLSCWPPATSVRSSMRPPESAGYWSNR